jgi:hypothetical protein
MKIECMPKENYTYEDVIRKMCAINGVESIKSLKFSEFPRTISLIPKLYWPAEVPIWTPPNAWPILLVPKTNDVDDLFF